MVFKIIRKKISFSLIPKSSPDRPQDMACFRFHIVAMLLQFLQPQLTRCRSDFVCDYAIISGQTFANCSHRNLTVIPSCIDNDTVHLDLSFNVIHSVLNNSLEELEALENVNLSHNKIRFVEMCSFCRLPKLQNLDMSYNLPDGLKLTRNLTYGLQFTNISTLTFTNMENPSGTGKRIQVSDLEFARNTSIKRLIISGNMIETIEEGSIDYMPPDLEEVDVSDNRPVFGPFLFQIGKLKQLRVLYADELNTYHPFDQLDKHAVEQKTKPNLKSNISSIPQSPTWCYFPLPPKLEEVYCRFSMIPYDIPKLEVCPNNSLRRVELNRNALSNWIGPIKGFNQLEYLDLSVNLCENISDEFFINLSSLRTLRVRANLIGYVMETNKVSDCPWLKPLINLVSLDLYLNKIRKIPAKCFSTLKNLENLNLKENSLTDWEVEIGHMPNISYIDLSGNSIDGFPKATRDHLSEVSKRRNVTVNLLGNELECICDNIEFLEWFDAVNINFVNKENYTCRDKHWKLFAMTNMKQIIADLKRSCAHYFYLNTIVSIFISCFILVVVYRIYYRYKWKLSYVYYMTWGRYNLIEDVDDQQYCYDAYISYAEEDNRFAEEELASKLGGLSLYLFDRDCKPGQNINATIVDKIEKSRKIILIFTSAYVRNTRCLFERNMADMKRIYRQIPDSICLIQLESLPHKDIPLDILKIFDAGLYVEYPHNQQGNNIFWEKLKNTIRPTAETV